VLNKDENTYDLSAARKHHEFMLMLHMHRINMVNTEEQIRSSEKGLIDVCDPSETTRSDDVHPETIESTTRHFQQEDGVLKKVYDSINGQMLNAMQSSEHSDLVKLINKLHNSRDNWEIVTDHLGRNILHYAV
jgi:hypothetical protein